MNGQRSLNRDLTTNEVATLCEVSLSTVLRWTDEKLLPFYFVPLSKHRRIRHKALVKFAREHGMPLKPLTTLEN